MLATPPPPAAHLPPPARCPACACELHGARLCEVCGAADFHGDGLWVCFACGTGNDVADDRCGACRKDHVIACVACGREGFHRDRFCEFCGAARALYPVILRALLEAARPAGRGAHGRALSLTVVLAVLALSAASALGVVGRHLEALAAGASGGAARVAAARRRRRGAAGGPR